MSVDTVTGGGDFRVSDVLARAWRVYAGNIAFFLGITLLTYVAIFIVATLVMVPLGIVWTSGNEKIALGLVATLVTIILLFSLSPIGQAALLHGAFQRLRGQPVRVGEALRRTFARFFPLIGLGILLTVALIVTTLLFIVPGAILLCMWWVAVPACVVENLGPLQSLRRSSDLTKGHRWQIFGLIALLTILNVVGANVLAPILSLVGGPLAAWGNVAWFVVWTAFWNCVLIIGYHDLRVAKEGIDTDQIAAIFD